MAPKRGRTARRKLRLEGITLRTLLLTKRQETILEEKLQPNVKLIQPRSTRGRQMSAKVRLAAMRELGEIFNLDNMAEIRNLGKNLQEMIDDMQAAAYKMPRNPCAGMCACSGACLKPEANLLLEQAERLQGIYYAIK